MQVDVDGRGPSLVLVHSLLTDAAAFDGVVPALAERRRVVRLSLPGFGSTPPLVQPAPVIADLADAVARGLAEAEVEPGAAVVGNGLGAFVCVALAIEHGHRFGPLIAANGGAGFSDERKLAFTKMADLVDEHGMEAVIDLAVHRIFTVDYLADHPKAAAERREVLSRIDPVAFAASCRALRDLDLRPQLAAIDKPTLVLAGGSDQTTPPEMAAELAAGISGAELATIDGCGHCPPLERPEAFIDHVCGFLDRLDGEMER